MAEHSVACHYRTSGLNVQQQLLSTCRINKAPPLLAAALPHPGGRAPSGRVCLPVSPGVGKREQQSPQGEDACVLTDGVPGAAERLCKLFPGNSKQTNARPWLPPGRA